MEQDISGEDPPSQVPKRYAGPNTQLHEHIHNKKMKVATRNNLDRKLSSSKWGTKTSTIRTTSLALSYSETDVPVWARSAHAYNLDSELNSTCRAITACLKRTNIEELYLLSGIAHPSIRRDVCARLEKAKHEKNEAHSLYRKSQQRDA